MMMAARPVVMFVMVMVPVVVDMATLVLVRVCMIVSVRM